jgi:hypothetical protein
MADPIVEAKIAEAANAAAVAHEANASAREAQMHETLVRALREVLVDGETEERPMLIKRIPFICNDILWIKKLMWLILSANGAVLLALIVLAIQRSFS